ncbi:SMI1/KNR4 family protein [Streptomyces sp. NBC_00083]|uniref:SMI1/KNR4 family protein n=1 Tax=Streptomyces sp. NBC_00083 TaxID=2975647 RepID=UPI002255BEC5|nr:SMI1/KNR4 family protein [Streptomyces sp. NBC_00083]MCX5386972.1 SMI1/KNR4 family protein [Streptomyces sp. NBC_00083]
MSNYLTRVCRLLGWDGDPRPCPDRWGEIEAEYSLSLPAEYKELIEKFAPAEIDNRLYLYHPGFDSWNLSRWMKETVDVFNECQWEEVTAPSLDAARFSFGSGGLIPLASTSGGEYLFLLARPNDEPLLIVHVGDDDDFYEYDMGFAEWLYRYLSDEEVTGPNSSAGRAAPVQVRRLPT